MQGLIYNLLAELAERAGCQDEAWDVALRSALGDTEDAALEESFAGAHADEDEDGDGVLPELPPLGVTTGATFKCLLRSAAPFRDEDWDDLPAADASQDLGRSGRVASTPEQPGPSERPRAGAPSPPRRGPGRR
jgi:hypothetical protein